jgi:UDP-N-acetylmuramyl pentapeptide synthase
VYAHFCCSRGNCNKRIGLPINLATIADVDKFAVVEMRMNKTGEIGLLTK